MIPRKEASSSENGEHDAHYESLEWVIVERENHSLQTPETCPERVCCACRMVRSLFRNQTMNLALKGVDTYTS